jgi:thioredoxin reductase (NADPH)
MIENYPGCEHIAGRELAAKMNDSALAHGVKSEFALVEDVVDHGDTKEIKCMGDDSYFAKTVIIATGCKYRLLGVPGEMTFAGRGVSYCAVCDGAFFKGKEVVVVGGGDSAVEEAQFLTQFASKVTIIHRRDELRAQKIIQERAFKNEKIFFAWDSVVEEVLGDKLVTGVKIRNVKTDEISEIPCGGAFIYVGQIPQTEMVASLGVCTDSGWVITDDHMKTNVPGVFAIGDVRDKDFRQIATAVGDGATAGVQAYHYLVDNNLL